MEAVMDLWWNILVPGVPLLEKVVRSVLVYVFLTVALRVAGRRELAQMTTFDLVVLLTISNTVQNAIIGEDTSVTGGILGAITMLGLNSLVVRFLYKHPKLEEKLEGAPTVLVRDGVIIKEACDRELVSESELMEAVRREGIETITEVHMVLLEANGNFSVVLKRSNAQEKQTADLSRQLEDLRRAITTLSAQVTAAQQTSSSSPHDAKSTPDPR
jgi:uncharacterized membrane protein YcaP (DUF421 family)